MTRKRIILLVAVVAVLLVVAFGGWQGVRAWWAWRGIERVEFDTAEVRTQLLFVPRSESPSDADLAPAEDLTPTPIYEVVESDTVLAVGSDALPLGDGDRQEGAYADAVLLWLVPTNGGDPALVSLPAIFLLSTPARGRRQDSIVRLSAAERLCRVRNSLPSRLRTTPGSVIERAVWEGSAELPDGCSTADGEDALMWMSSRTTQEVVDGEWQFVEGVSDLNRTER